MKDEEINKLIKESLKTDKKGLAAARKLLSAGIEAVPEIVAAIQNRDAFENLGFLPKILRQIDDPKMVSILLELVDDENFDLQLIAFQLLPRFKDKKTFAALTDFLQNEENLDTSRSLAAEALGELQAEEAVPFLLKTVDKTDDNELKLSAVISLAKLGNNEKSATAIQLATHKKDPTIRPKATKALQYVIVENLFETLKKTIRDKYSEMRINSINALFYLGAKDSIPVLIEAVADKDIMVSSLALKRIEDLTGEFFEEETSAKQLEKWWESEASNYKKNICYRLGNPLEIEKIIESMKNENTQNLIIQELKIITGIDFSSDKFTAEEREKEQSEKINNWLKSNEIKRFENGALYKYGRKQDLKVVF